MCKHYEFDFLKPLLGFKTTCSILKVKFSSLCLSSSLTPRVGCMFELGQLNFLKAHFDSAVARIKSGYCGLRVSSDRLVF